jgi:triosephosphate isomerase
MALKTKLAVSSGLQVMACVGEPLEVRQANKTMELILEDQMAALKEALNEVYWWCL